MVGGSNIVHCMLHPSGTRYTPGPVSQFAAEPEPGSGRCFQWGYSISGQLPKPVGICSGQLSDLFRCRGAKVLLPGEQLFFRGFSRQSRSGRRFPAQFYQSGHYQFVFSTTITKFIYYGGQPSGSQPAIIRDAEPDIRSAI